MYQSFFNLSNKPFRLSPDPRFFFPSRGHKRALAYLRYGLSQDEGFVVITGAPGTGKTTLAKILLQEMDDKHVVVAHLTTTQLDADDMLRMVAASFGLRYEGLDKTGLLKALEHFLLARARERKRALLVIDEAQNLPARSLEELRMLSNLQVGDKALVQTFLLGQAQFRQMLDDPNLEQLRQRVIANYHLSPLASDECQRYIETRLEMVGWNNDPHFAEVAYEMIQEYTAGIPRRINMLCDRVLLYCCMEETHEVTGEVIQFVTKELDQEVSGKPLDIITEEDLAKSQEIVVESFKSRFGTNKKNRRPAKSARIMEGRGTGGDDESELAEKQKKRATASARKQKSTTNKDSAAKGNGANHKPDKNGGGEQVVGNTIKQRPSRKPDLSGSDHHPGHAEISDRDLFRVIPGGKPDEQFGKPAIPKRPSLPALQAQPSAEDVVQRRILRLVLAYHRSPSRFPGLDNASQPLPEGISELLELAVADDQVLNRVSPAAVMGISPVMLRAAVRFFIRRALFVVDGDDYRVLGLQPGAPQSLVEKHYDLLMRLLRQDKQRGSADSVTRVGQAYESLSRIDQAKQGPPPTGVSLPVPQSPPAAPWAETSAMSSIELTDNDSDELTIDFDVINKQEIAPPRSPFVGKPNEIFAPQTNFARKRLRYAGQLAVGGFGALVFILGLYIVQMEPSDSPVKPGKTVVKNGQQDRSVDFERQRQRGLRFSDGFANPPNRAEFANQGTQQPIVSKPESGDRAVFAESASIEQGTMSNQDKQLVAQLEEIARLETQKQRDQQKVASSAQVKPLAIPPRKAGPRQKLVKNRVREPQSVQTRKPVSHSRKSNRIAGNLNQLNITSKPMQTRTTRQNKVVISKKAESKVTLTVAPKSYKGKEIALASKTQVSKAQSTPTTQPKAAQPKAPTAQSATRPRSVSNSRLVTIATNKNLVKNKPRTITTNPTIKSSLIPGQPKVSNRDLNGLLSQFSSAYKTGNLDEIMSVFAPNARTNNQTSPSGIRKDYIDLFKTTRARNMAFNDINWARETNHARGVGHYTATITLKSGGNPQIYSGEVTLQVQNRAGKLKITRFYYTGQAQKSTKKVISAKPATRPKPRVAPTITTKSVLPTAVELQTLVVKFLSTYAKGDLKGLMALFAEDAKTNDQPNKAGIRKDHLDLFNSTQVRQMTINNFVWANEGTRSNGVGDFQVMIQPNNSGKFTTVKGKIRIIAQKTPGGVFITHLLHTIK